jgi:autotransporter adhesin
LSAGAALPVIAACALNLSTPASAQTAVVSACSGVSLPPSVVTNIAGQVLTPVLTPVESILSTLTLGSVNLGLSNALANAAAGQPINLGAVDVNGDTVDPLTTSQCETQSDSFSLKNPKGISFGGNKITGLGTTGLVANAGELDAIAIGDSASTAVGAFGSIAIGKNASATHGGSIALGANSVADGATLGNAAYLVGGTASAELNIGDRRISGLAAGAEPTDAVNVAQLKSVNDVVIQNTTDIATNTTNIANLTIDLTALDDIAVKYTDASKSNVALEGVGGTRISNLADGVAATDAVNLGQLNAVSAAAANTVHYDDGSQTIVTLAGAGGTVITNVAAGAVNAGSTDAVNGAQLNATNVNVASNTTDITNLQYDLQGLDDIAVKYTDGGKATVVLGGASGTRITNLTDGDVSAGSTDAVNGSQLNATNVNVANNTANIAANTANIATNTTNIANLTIDLTALDDIAVKYTDSSKSNIVLGGVGGTRIANVADGVAASDAVNLGQLTAVSTIVNNLQQDALLFDSIAGAYNARRSGIDQRITGVADGVLANDAVNLGQLNAVAAAAANAVHYDDGTQTKVTLGGAGGTVVTNVAAGAVNAASTDAVNGAQLHATNQHVDQVEQSVHTLAGNVAQHLGGGAAANPDGSVSAPNYVLQTVDASGNGGTASYDNVGDALTSLGTSITNVNQRLTNVEAVNDRAVTYDGPSGAPKDTITLAGSNGTKISNVTAGDVSAGSTDAVNGAQLNATNVQLDYALTNILNLQNGTDGFLQVNNSSNRPKPAATGTDSVAAGGGAIASGAGSTAFGMGAQATAANSVALGNGSVADRANSMSVGWLGHERQITNVADGTSATDAVNLRQLQASAGETLTEANAYTDHRFSQINASLKALRRDANASTAAAMAMAGIPQSSEPGGSMLGFGVSTWQGQRAIAMGLSKSSDNGRVVIRAAATYNTRNMGGASAGIGFAF